MSGFEGIKQFLTKPIGKPPENDRYDSTETLKRAGKLLNRIIDLNELLNGILDTVAQALEMEKAYIYLAQMEKPLFRLFAYRDYSSGFKAEMDEGENFTSPPEFIEADHPIISILYSNQEPLNFQELGFSSNFKIKKDKIAELKNKLGAELAVPIQFDEKFIGILFAGARQSKLSYTSKDIELLHTLMLQTALSIENASKVDKLRKMVEIEASYKKLKESDELKSALYANISHEFRNPLTLCIELVDSYLKQDEFKSGTSDVGKLKIAKRNLNKMLNLINKLLDFSALEVNFSILRLRSHNLGKFIEYVVNSFQSWAERADVDLGFYSDRNLPEVYCDIDKMEKMLVNLLTNALKYTDRGGRIKVKVNKHDDHLEVIVEDTGRGIDERDLTSIFDRYAQAHNHLIRDKQGTGIGLSITKDFVEMHGGKIGVKSILGEGSTFFFTVLYGKDHFDLSKAEFLEDNLAPYQFEYDEITEPEMEIDSYPSDCEDNQCTFSEGLPTVLVVEDDKDMRNFLSNVLSKIFNVVVARDGIEGFNKVIDLCPDLVLSDVIMPQMDGLSLCKRIRNNDKTSNIPIILITARADHKMIIKALASGATDCLFKPFKKEEIQLRVTNLIRLKKMEGLYYETRFRKFFSTARWETIINNNESIYNVKRKRLTILFSDIRNFTTYADEHEPEDTIEILNNYLSEMSQIIENNSGTIDKFIGDEIMAVFGDPIDMEDHAIRAISAAIEMQQKMKTMIEDWERKGKEKLFIGIGINTGYVTVGGFGSDKYLDYTVIGNQVNLASRLQSEARNGEIIISNSTYGEVKDIIEAQFKGEIEVKGIKRKIPIFSVSGLKL